MNNYPQQHPAHAGGLSTTTGGSTGGEKMKYSAAGADSDLSYRDLLAALWLMPLSNSTPVKNTKDSTRSSRSFEEMTERGMRLLGDIFGRFALEQERGITKSSLRYTLAPSSSAGSGGAGRGRNTTRKSTRRTTGLNGFERVTGEELSAIFNWYCSTSGEERERTQTTGSEDHEPTISFDQYKKGLRKIQNLYAKESANNTTQI